MRTASDTGRSQVGRIRYTGEKEQLQEEVPFSYSGISGVQPKILVRDEKAFAQMEHTGNRLSQSYRGATHIVKLWEPNEYPQLAPNEYFCLMAAHRCGLDVPPVRLAEEGMALVLDRFDLRMEIGERFLQVWEDGTSASLRG